MSKQIAIAKSTYDFFLTEVEQMHTLCDRAKVPREIEGSALSTAQRVAILEGAYQGLVVRIGMDPLYTEQ